MRGNARNPLSVAGLLAIVLATSAPALQGPVSINGDGPDASGLLLILTTTNACGLVVDGSVTTDAGGGTDTFAIRITDEGVVIASQNLAFPADGGSHAFSFQLDFEHIFINDNYGLIIDDPGGLGVVVVPEVFTIDSCSIQNIPALSTAGATGLGLLLAAAAAVVLARRRRA